MEGGGGNQQFSNLSDISFGNYLSKVNTGGEKQQRTDKVLELMVSRTIQAYWLIS